MRERDDQFWLRPGRTKDRGSGSLRTRSFTSEVVRAAYKAGGRSFGRSSSGKGARSGSVGRGRVSSGLGSSRRRVIVKARIVKQRGSSFRSAPLARHIAYLEREGVARGGREPEMFGADGQSVDGDAFAERCEDDRHYFRFMISPEDGVQMDDLRCFAIDLMAQMEKDLDTKLDWAGIDHWNTDQPHVHILVRGRADDGSDLVISRDYISRGIRSRAEELVTLELGPRSELEIATSLQREVTAERWTSLDQTLQRIGDRHAGEIELSPDATPLLDKQRRALLIGRAQHLESMELADRIGASAWTIKPGAQAELRELGMQGDIIKTMHKAMTGQREHSVAEFAIHDQPNEPIIGKLVERGLHDELAGSAFVVIDGTDGRVHHLRVRDLEDTGLTPAGGIVEARMTEAGRYTSRLRIVERSPMSIEQQIDAPGATWLDRNLVVREPVALANSGFGREVSDALEARTKVLEEQGLARRQGQRIIFAQDLLDTLKGREVAIAIKDIEKQTGLTHKPSATGNLTTGIYRQRVNLASGRFAMIDNGMGFELVPWKPELDPQLGKLVRGTKMAGGGIDWELGLGRGIGR